jgi:peptidoglycan/xylan/chitin deacetylase (PgdA/CDA1 family)
MSRETMTAADHRSPDALWTAAVVGSLVSGTYLLPALSYYLPQLRSALGISRTTLDGRGFALTFDDGPHRLGTPAVLAELARREARATFFLVGEQVARDPGLAREVVDAGHEIGLHCDRHRNLLRLGPRAVAQDIARARARIEDSTGRAVERYRPPYGIFNAAAIAIAKRNGWRPLLWTHWGRDWEPSATPQSIAQRLVGGEVAEGSVLLLHDADDYGAANSWQRTVAALPLILDELAGRGLQPSVAV